MLLLGTVPSNQTTMGNVTRSKPNGSSNLASSRPRVAPPVPLALLATPP